MYFSKDHTYNTLANNTGPDEMSHFAAFHLGLHCLPKYPFRGFPVYKGLKMMHHFQIQQITLTAK